MIGTGIKKFKGTKKIVSVVGVWVSFSYSANTMIGIACLRRILVAGFNSSREYTACTSLE